METNKVILVIEDNLADFVLLQTYLRSVPHVNGHEIIHSKSLEKVLAIKDDIYPEIIFVDLKLPDSSGLETFLTVNSIFPLSTIIILSGLEDKVVALHAIQAGAQDFILKSDFDEKLLDKIIQYSIERKLNQQKLKESNIRFEFVSKATNDPIWDWDLTTNAIFWNDRVSIFGYPSAILKNNSWRELNIHPEDRGRVIRKMEKFLSSKAAETWTDTYRFKCLDGSYKFILDRGYIIRKKEGEAYRMIGSMQDITIQVLLEEELHNAQTERQHEILKAVILGQEKEKKEIGEELHDNINQILAAIKMFLGIAKQNKNRLKEMLDLCYNKTDQVMNEIRKLSHSLVPPSLGDISLKEAIMQLVEEINLDNRVKIEFVHKGDIDITNSEKALVLYRVIQEQLSNILKHSHATEAAIFLQINDKEIALSIGDNGTGFDKMKTAQGIGIKNIVNRINAYSGDIKIETAPGNGCKIKILIPN